MNASIVPLLVALLIGLGMGAGTTYVMMPKPSSTSVEEKRASASEQSAMTATGIEPAPGMKDLPPPPPGTKPITAKELQAEFSSMDGFGFGLNSLRRYADLADRLRVSDPAAIARELLASPNQPSRDMGWSLVMGAFAEQDPNGAWAFAQGLPPGPQRQMGLSAVISSIAGRDPNRAIALADSIEEPGLKNQIRSMALASVASRDPRRAFEIAKAGEGGNEDFSMSSIIYQWARRDPEAAKAATLGLTGRVGDQARMTLMSALTQQDPLAAWQLAQTMPRSGEPYQDPRFQVIQNWANTDPQAALRAALEIPEQTVRNNALSSAISSWSRNDFSGALQYALSVQDSGLRSDVLRAMSMNPSGDRAKLLDAVIEHMPAGDNFQQAISGIFSSWARENPAAAAAGVSKLPPGRIYSQAVSNIASQWASSGNPEEVLRWANGLPEGEPRRNALHSVFSNWSGDQPEKAIAAAASMSPDERRNVHRAIAQGWSRRDPEAVLRWAGSLSDSDERRDIVQNAVGNWASNSPESAARYVERLPEADRGPAMASVVDRWASRDAEAAAEWLARQPAGPPRDGAVVSLARKIAAEDPETALSWAATISDEKNRGRQMENLARDWVRQDAASARAWIQTSSFSAEVRERLLK